MSTKDSIKEVKENLESKNGSNDANVTDAELLAGAAALELEEDEELLDLEAEIGTEVETYKKFKPRPEYGDLCLGFLIGAEVKLTEIPTIKADGLTSDYEYAGHVLPSLVLSFKEEPTKEDVADRRYYEYIKPIVHRKNDGTETDPKTIVEYYQNEYKALRHIANALVGHPNYVPIKIPGLNIKTGIVEKRLSSLKGYYEAWATLFAGKDGKGFAGTKLWIKLIASSDGGRLIMPRYVAEGFVERWVEGRKPSIEIRINETVTLTKKEKGTKTSTGKFSSGATAASTTPSYSSDVEDILKNYGA